MLLGREAPMRSLRDALAQAARGRGRLAVVTGEAGMGKTALVEALAAEAERAGAEVTWGRAWDFADAPPYFPVRAALRALGLDPSDTTYRGDGGEFHLWEAVAVALSSRTTPVVWFVEDLHGADLQTLDLLTFLAQAVRALPALVVVTARPHDPRLDERASSRLTRLAREGLDIRLAALSETEVAEVAEHAAGGPLPRAVARELAALTSGVPLFVVECARTFRSSGRLGPLPPTVRHVVLDRFRLLGAETREALALGAVLGRELTAARVARMQGTLPARVVDALLPALRAGFVTEAEPGRFVFSHAIVRDVIEEELGAERKAEAHARAAAALAAEGTAGTEVLVERARHLLEAAALGDVADALALARRAATVLDEAGAHDRAHALCRRILAVGEAHGAPEPPAAELLAFAEIAHAAGDSSTCGRLCERVLAASRAAGDAEVFGRATLLTGAVLRPGVVDGALVTRLQEARGMLGDHAPALALRVEARLAAALQPAADPRGPMGMAWEAIERARALGDEAATLAVLDTAASAIVDYGPVAERLALFEEIRSRAELAGDRPRLARAHARLAMDHATSGAFQAFEGDVDAALRVAAELGHPRHTWRPLLLASMRAVARGDVQGSEGALVEIEELASLTDDPALALAVGAHRLTRALVMHHDRACRDASAALPDVVPRTPFGALIVAAYRGWIHARLEEDEACRREIARETELVAMFTLEPASAACVAEAIARVGSDAGRRRMREVLTPHITQHHVGGHVCVSYDGPIRRSVALLDAALGERERAKEGLLLAREAMRVAGYEAWVARLDYDLACLARDDGRSDEARAHAAEAEGLARRLGLEGLVARAAKLGAGAPSLPVPPPAPLARFTLAKEGEVYSVGYGARVARVPDSRGMQLLARLVEHAGEEIHVLALASDDPGGGLTESDAGEALDARARTAYRERLDDLETAIAEAERNADRGRLARLAEERAMLTSELARAVGLGGRERRQGSATERARVNVQRRLKDALGRVAEVDPEAGRYLERAVRTGTFCSFRP